LLYDPGAVQLRFIMKKKQGKKGKKHFQSEDAFELKKPKRREKKKKQHPKAWLEEAIDWRNDELKN